MCSTVVKVIGSNIWRKFCSFEVRVGDLASVCKIEKRRGMILRNQVS